MGLTIQSTMSHWLKTRGKQRLVCFETSRQIPRSKLTYSLPDPPMVGNLKGRRFQVQEENLVNMANTAMREHQKVYQTKAEKDIIQ